MHKATAVLIVSLGILLQTGCTAQATADRTLVEARRSKAEAVRGEAALVGEALVCQEAPPVPPDLIAHVRQDLAYRLKVSVNDVCVVHAHAEESPGSGLGCKEPGTTYFTKVVANYRMVLQARGARYTYHAVPPELTAAVRQDLANRLKIDVQDVCDIQIQAVEWADGRLDCASHRIIVPLMREPGFRMVLQARGTRYTYHTNGGPNNPMPLKFVQCRDGQPVGQ